MSPENTTNKEVIAAVIERNGSLLVCRRPLHKRHGGLWEFPGGKIESGETLLEAADRELKEELAMRATASGCVRFSVTDQASGYVINFVEVSAEGDPQLLEHMEYAWVSPNDLMKFNLAPSDRNFVEHLNMSKA